MSQNPLQSETAIQGALEYVVIADKSLKMWEILPFGKECLFVCFRDVLPQSEKIGFIKNKASQYCETFLLLKMVI